MILESPSIVLLFLIQSLAEPLLHDLDLLLLPSLLQPPVLLGTRILRLQKQTLISGADLHLKQVFSSQLLNPPLILLDFILKQQALRILEHVELLPNPFDLSQHLSLVCLCSKIL